MERNREVVVDLVNCASSAGRSGTEMPVVLVYDLGATRCRAALVKGELVLGRRDMGTANGSTQPADLVTRMVVQGRLLCRELGYDIGQLAGVGADVPGPTWHSRGIVHSLTNVVGWRDVEVPLASLLASGFQTEGLRAFVENDAKAAAVGEHQYGAGRGRRNLTFIIWGTGIGSGLIVDDHLLEGEEGTANELGHMCVDIDGPDCPCGSVGCVERLASGLWIGAAGKELFNHATSRFRRWVEEQGKGLDDIDAALVAEAAGLGEPKAHQILRRAVRAFAFGVINGGHILNPGVFILGGGVWLGSENLLKPMVIELFHRHAMRIPRKADIVTAELGDDSGLIGMAHIVYQKLGLAV